MSYTNDINYLSSLEMLVNGFDSEYPFIEKNVNEMNYYYETRIDTGNIFAGDRLESFNIKANGISKVILTIDGVSVYCENFQMANNINITPFINGIRVFCCKNSEIILYIKSSSKPNIETIYSLLNATQKSIYNECIGELYYKNGYAFLNLPPVGR